MGSFGSFKAQEEKRILLEEIAALKKQKTVLSSKTSPSETPTPKVAAPSPKTSPSATSVAPSQRSDESGDDGHQPEEA